MKRTRRTVLGVVLVSLLGRALALLPDDQAEAMAEGDYVLLVGLKPGAEPTKDSKAVVDKLLNLFIGGASKL